MIPLAIADLEITPSSITGSVYVTIPKQTNLSIRNTYDFTIYDIKFSSVDHITFPTILQLNPNATENITVTVNTNTAFSTTTFSSVIEFKYKSSIDLDPVTHEVNISNEEFIPQIISIRLGDSIKFNNNASVVVELIDTGDTYFHREVEPSQSITIPQGTDHAFDTVAQIDYHDLNDITKIGRINVQNLSEELIHNADYDKIFTISYDSIWEESELGLEIFPENNISVEHDSFQELNLRIFNKGDKKIYNITIRADEEEDWFTFQDNNFSLDPNQNRYITFRIAPFINKTEETNKTYEINLIADAENANSISTELEIFIPYSEKIYSRFFTGDYWEQREIYCAKSPWDIMCNPPPQIITEKVIEYLNSTIEYTKEDAMKNDREQNKRLTSIETNQEKTTKSMNTITSDVTGLTNAMNIYNDLLNESNQLSKEAIERSESRDTGYQLFVLLGIILAILILVYFTFKYVIKYKRGQYYN